MRRLISMKSYRRLLFVGVLIIACILVIDYGALYTTIQAERQLLTSSWRKRISPEPQKTHIEEERRPRAFYPWIGDSGQILNGTKPPVYGVFVLLDLDSSSSMKSRGRGDTLIERLTNHDFGFTSCHQVMKTAATPWARFAFTGVIPWLENA